MKAPLIKNLFWLILLVCLSSSLSFAQEETEIEQELFKELNAIRANPQSYIAHLEEYKRNFSGKSVQYQGITMATTEGVKAVDDAIKFLQKQSKLEPFTNSIGLTKAAKLQLTDLLEDYSLGHKGKDGSTVPKRAGRFGKGGKLYAENLIDGIRVPKDIIMMLIIDDGVSSRGHRKNIFNKSLKFAGIAYGVNRVPVTVMVFADKFVENGK